MVIEIVIIIFQVFSVSHIMNESKKLREENNEFKQRIEKMYSENISDIILENQNTLRAINDFIKKASP
jgi:hypothetical protein